MDKYSRLLVTFKTVDGNIKDDSSFIKDLTVLISPTEDLLKLIKDDLHIILPAILNLSVNSDINIRTAIASTFDTFRCILKDNPSVKSEPWWKDMETKLIASQFSQRLVKMVEVNDEPWAQNWAFVTRLIVHDEHVHGVAINSLLKVVETAFKMSRRNDAIMEKAYYCWNQLIDIFSNYPRVVCSQKLVELLVRPLSTTNLSFKCPELKMQTWQHLMKKIGFMCGNKCIVVIDPFIDFMYLKGGDSLCVNFSKDCLQSFSEMLEQKKIYRYYALKALSAFPRCYESCLSDDLHDLLVVIWANILGNVSDVDKNIQSDYFLEIFRVFHQVLQIDRPELNSRLMKIFVDNKICNIYNLRLCVSSQLPLIQMLSDFMNYDDFRSCSFPTIVKDLMENFSDANSKKPQNNVDLQLWDLLCDMYVTWLKSSPQNSPIVHQSVLSSLLMIPFVNKQWSVALQKTWFNLVDSIHSAEAENDFLPHLIEKISEGLKQSHISAPICIEICTHLTNCDKGAFKVIMPALSVASSYLPPKDSKPLLDMLVLLENAVGRVPKSELMKFLNELMIFGNKYEHPYGLRIKTKISKVQRKLFALKENNEVEQEGAQQNKSEKDEQQASGCRNRSPKMAQSNFLLRLAKAEEKKKKKSPSMASIFGDSAANQEVSPSDLSEKSAPVRALSPINSKQNNEVKGNKDAVKGNKEVFKENEKVVSSNKETASKDLLEPPLVNGRCSPVIPQSVHIVTPTRAKRSQAKSPDRALVSQSPKVNKKMSSIKSPAPPTYFEDDAQDYVFVPPKAKTTPLTEHQKELFSKRRTDIPALYQDLSQDTLSDSQSLKEITVLKENKINFEETPEKAEDPGNTKKGADSLKIIDETINSDNSESQNNVDLTKSGSKDIQESSEIVVNGIPSENQEANNACLFNNSKLSKNLVNNCIDSISEKIDNGIKTENQTELRSSCGENINKEFLECNNKEPDTSENSESQEIIESTPQFEPAVSLNLTPTKHHGPPTPRNLINRMKLLENEENSSSNKKSIFVGDDEVDEFEKENIIIKTKQGTDKTPINSVKRQSSLRGKGKLIPKRNEENFEGNIKNRKENAECYDSICVDEVKGGNKTSHKVEPAPATPEVVEPFKIIKSDVINIIRTSESQTEPVKESKLDTLNTDIPEKNCGLTKSKIDDLVSKENTNQLKTKVIEMKDQLPHQETTVVSLNCGAAINHSNTQGAKIQNEEVHTSENSKDTSKITNNNEIIDSSELKPNNNNETILIENDNDENIVAPSDDNSESPSGVVSDWAMTTPAKRGRKRKDGSIKKEINLSPHFSPKQLRSKRLSLTKSLDKSEQSTRKMRKSAPSTLSEKKKPDNNLLNAPNDKSSPANKSDSETSVISPNIEDVTPKKRGRKRKSLSDNNQEVEEKKKKPETQLEEVNQDSVLVVKNSMVKPRKKKIIKSNIKQSPSNLELWLLKTGKTVVKTSLISQENSANEPESTMIEESAEIQINVGDSKNVVVEIPTSSPKENTNNQNPNIVIVEASPEVPSDSDDVLNCTQINDSPSFRLNISEDEHSIKLNESTADIPLEGLDCQETVNPPNPEPSTSDSLPSTSNSLPSTSVPPSASDPLPSTSDSLPSTSDEVEDSIGLRAHRRKRRLLRRELTPSRDIPGSPEDENFENKRERLTTPFRPGLGSSGRSAQMVMMATGDDEQEAKEHTPVRRRSIPAIRLTDNWPEGRLEDWVPCMPTPPGRSPSRCILRRKPLPSPSTSPSSSPSVKKKRVSFLDPPVSKGLLYCKGETIGQVQHANIPDGERPLWREDGESEVLTPQRPTSRSTSGEDGSDELTAIQEFLNSTPDAPWSKTIPPELDVRKIAGLESRTESIEELLKRLTDGDEERNELYEEVKSMNVLKVADICSVSLKNLNKLCSKFVKVKSLAKITEEYVKSKDLMQTNVEAIAAEPGTRVESSEGTSSELEPSVRPSTDSEIASQEQKLDVAQVSDVNEEVKASHEMNDKSESTESIVEIRMVENKIEENLMEVDEPEPAVLPEVDKPEAQSTPEIDSDIEKSKVPEDSKTQIESEQIPKQAQISEALVDMEAAKNMEFEDVQKDEAPLLSSCKEHEEPSEETRKEQLSEMILLLRDKRYLALVADKIPQLLEDDSAFVEALASHASLSFLARLISAMDSFRQTPD